MNLNKNNWKLYSIDMLFNVTAGLYHYPSEYEEGETPYLSATNIYNGVKEKINLSPDFEGNCITTGKVGCTAFYQEEPFCATSDVNILRPKHFTLNRNIGLFITTIINFSENYKWNYGRQCRVSHSKKINIKLPTVYLNDDPVIDTSFLYSEDGYIPDFNFIDNYMNLLNTKTITTTINKSDIVIDTPNWKDYSLGDLFDNVYKAKPHVKANMTLTTIMDPKGINFITRTDKNNGCDAYVSLDDSVKKIEDANAIIIGDTTSTIFYQDEKFVTGDHIVVCRANWLNKYTGIFIKTLLERERYRYNYGRAFKMDIIKSTILKLPANNDGSPDWKYIEKYIQSLPFSDRI